MADPNKALRVSQLDAAELDSEIVLLTKSQLVELFKYQQTNFLVNYEPEINAFLKLLIWKFSIDTANATIGQAMLNLRYLNKHAQSTSNQWMSRKQKILYACLLIGCPWLRDRSHELIKLLWLENWKDKIYILLKWTESMFKLCTLVNFLLFLQKGDYVSLLERVIGIRSVFPEKQGIRQVTFEFLTRELLWHGFAEFLFFVLPLINIQKLKNFIVQRLLSSSLKSSPSNNVLRNFTSCAICRNWPNCAKKIGCSHVFCYFCIQSHFLADPRYACPLCMHAVGDASNIQSVSIMDLPTHSEDHK